MMRLYLRDLGESLAFSSRLPLLLPASKVTLGKEKSRIAGILLSDPGPTGQ